MNADQIAAKYTQPGKVATRKFVVDLAKATGCKTALDFWGGGTSARAFAEAGIAVTSAEVERAYWPEMEADAALHGYSSHRGRASLVDGTFDIVWADFTGQVSRLMERELQALRPRVGKYLVVTLLPERENDPFLVRARSATIPAWLLAVTGLGLDYITRYRRNRLGQEMWLAVLSGRRLDAHISPATVARNLNYVHRRYWSAQGFRGQGLLPATDNIRTKRLMRARRCLACGESFTPKMNPNASYCVGNKECQLERDRRISQRNRDAKRVTRPK